MGSLCIFSLGFLKEFVPHIVGLSRIIANTIYMLRYLD